jgi:rod shape-determining protein MreD
MNRDGNAMAFIISLLLSLVLQAIALPDAITAFRPLVLAMTLAYWAIYAPEMPVLLTAWILGLCCDVLYGAPLGQYALGLVTVAYAASRLSSTLLTLPQWQGTLALAPVWALYVFLMFWIDGLTHHAADPLRRWLPLISTSLLWPLAAGLLGSIHDRRGRRGILP